MSIRTLLMTTWLGRALILLLGVAVAQSVVSQLVTSDAAAGHALFHGLFAVLVLGVAIGIRALSPTGGLTTAAPAAGLAVFVIPQIVESFGAYGYSPDNATRNSLAVIHDLGQGLSVIGLVAAVLGIAVGIWAAARARSGRNRRVIQLASLVVFALGLVGLKTMIGM
jgi:hypothetical protein